MTLPQTFPTPPPSAIASYDHTDIATGLGCEFFYLYSGEDSTGTFYKLTDNSSIYSYTKYRQYAAATDVDFDTSVFNDPRTVKGTAIFNLGYAVDGASGNAYIVCKIRKWDGTTETELGSVQSPTIAVNADGILTMYIDISQTHFKKGDILRFTIEGYQGGAGVMCIGHDPQNRADAGPPITITLSRVLIPFKITDK